jgi:ribonuclease HII
MPHTFEARARKKGYRLVAGIDEAGRGPLAGPVVAGAVILPEGLIIGGLADSKTLPEDERERLFAIIMEKAVSVGVGIVDSTVVDQVNILQATLAAMLQAAQKLNPAPGILLIDGNQPISWPGPQQTIIKGDALCHSISAASVVAKVTRDRIMARMALLYPQYGFGRHKGYGVPEHREAIRRHGPCPIHRMTFKGVREFTGAPPIPQMELLP